MNIRVLHIKQILEFINITSQLVRQALDLNNNECFVRHSSSGLVEIW